MSTLTHDETAPAHDHLRTLEAEAVHIIREVAAEFERPVLLFSGGKDSIVMLHLALKAFAPAPVPFALLHVDTGHNFPEVLDYPRPHRRRARPAAARGARAGLHRRRPAARAPRRDPQPAADRAAAGRDPIAQVRRRLRRRPPRRGEGPRQGAGLLAARRLRAVGPASASARSCGGCTTAGTAPASTCASSRCRNWTELDVWQYIEREEIELPAIYYAHEREVFAARRHVADRRASGAGRSDGRDACRRGWCATAPSATCPAPAPWTPTPPTSPRSSPRSPLPGSPSAGATRADDKLSEAAMEDRKREGYF